jgi:hypothetical protein
MHAQRHLQIPGGPCAAEPKANGMTPAAKAREAIDQKLEQPG